MAIQLGSHYCFNTHLCNKALVVTFFILIFVLSKTITMKLKNANKLDKLIVEQMVNNIKEQQETKTLQQKDFFLKLFNDRNSLLNKNDIYKRTPYYFKGMDVYFIQLFKAFKIVNPNLLINDYCNYAYNNYVILAITPALDVTISNVKRYLKLNINNLKYYLVD